MVVDRDGLFSCVGWCGKSSMLDYKLRDYDVGEDRCFFWVWFVLFGVWRYFGSCYGREGWLGLRLYIKVLCI